MLRDADGVGLWSLELGHLSGEESVIFKYRTVCLVQEEVGALGVA